MGQGDQGGEHQAGVTHAIRPNARSANGRHCGYPFGGNVSRCATRSDLPPRLARPSRRHGGIDGDRAKIEKVSEVTFGSEMHTAC
jgi:hypothetical protein